MLLIWNQKKGKSISNSAEGTAKALSFYQFAISFQEFCTIPVAYCCDHSVGLAPWLMMILIQVALEDPVHLR